MELKSEESLLDDFADDALTKFIDYKGVFLLPTYQLIAEAIENFEVRDDDVWICSHPKTGTTWTQEMAWNICNDLDFHGAKESIRQRYRFLEFSMFSRTDETSIINEISNIAKVPSPRFIKTHLPFHLLPLQLRTQKTGAKIIYITRNPKDVSISFHHHYKLFKGYNGEFEKFCELFLGGKTMYSPFWKHVNGYWEKKDNENILCITYEDMQTDLQSVIRKCAAFFDKELSDQQVHDLQQHLSFSNMKDNPSVNYQNLLDDLKKSKIYGEDFDYEGKFMRKGTSGQWKNAMSGDLIKKFDDWIAEGLKEYPNLRDVFGNCTMELKSKEILLDGFVDGALSKYIYYKGVSVPHTYQLIADAIENFEVRDDDVWVCSFPRTGTTWTQEMVWNICNDLDFHGAKTSILQRFPYIEFSIFSRMDRTGMRDEISNIAKLPSPRFIKTHLPFHLLPLQLRTQKKEAKIIYVTRNPKDACISLYYHNKLLEGYNGELEKFCKLFLDDKVMFAPFWENVNGYWEKKGNKNILCLKYEDMKNDLQSVIRKTAAFLNKQLSNQQVHDLEHHLSFSNMKNNSAVNYKMYVNHLNESKRFGDDFVHEGEFMRKGTSGQWKNALSGDMIKKFDEWIVEELKKYPNLRDEFSNS